MTADSASVPGRNVSGGDDRPPLSELPGRFSGVSRDVLARIFEGAGNLKSRLPGQLANRPPKSGRRIRNDRYSLFVRLMKRGLPMIALGMIALVLIWPNLDFESSKYRKSVLSQLKLQDVENLTLVKATYSGADEKNRPYTVTAEKAIQASAKADLVRLVAPAADMTLNTGKWVAITAERGEFRQKSKELSLIGQVSLFHDDGYSLTTERAEINMETGSAVSKKPVLAKGPLGTIKSQGFKMSEKGKRITFTGRARLVIFKTKSLSFDTKQLKE